MHFIRISASEDIAYVGSISDGLLIIDVTIPANPVLVGSYDPGFNSVNDFAVTADGSIGFLAAGDHGLMVLDLGDPSDPRLMATYEVSTNCTINGQPVFSGNCSAGGVALTSDETTVFVASAWGGTKILDVAEPNSPHLISTIPAGPSLIGKIVLSMDERTAYIIGSGGVGGLPFRTYDLSDLTAPLLLGSYGNEFGGYSAIELSMDEETVYLGGINIGLEILDVTDTTAPKLRASFQEVINQSAPQVLGIDVTLDETVGFLAGNVDGLRVVWVDTPGGASPPSS